MSTPDDDLGPEREELKRLAKDIAPPPGLENRVVDAMRAEGIIRPKSRFVRIVLPVAASLLIFVTGLIVGQRWKPAPVPDPRPDFALLLYQDANYQTAPPDELPGRISEYGRWARGLGAGNYIGGEKLVESESTVSKDGIVGPAAPSPKSGSVAGYFLIRANDESEAAKIAATCPHVRYGGFVSVRQLER